MPRHTAPGRNQGRSVDRRRGQKQSQPAPAAGRDIAVGCFKRKRRR